MSGDYHIICSCGADSEGLHETRGDTIVSLVNVLPELERIRQEDLDITDVRGSIHEQTDFARVFLLEHWRHGTLSYYYDNGDCVPVPLIIPERAGLPDPCLCCGGRRLIPCPEC